MRNRVTVQPCVAELLQNKGKSRKLSLYVCFHFHKKLQQTVEISSGL